MDKQRNLPINKTQKDVLIEFMKNHPELQSGRFSSDFTFKKAQQLWEEVSELLNSIAGGATKDWRQWRKTWQDLKKNVKHKAVENKTYCNKTGGGGPNPSKLSSSEMLIFDMISPVSVDGVPSIKESNIQFEFENNEPSVEIFSDEMDCSIEINSENKSETNSQNGEHFESTDLSYSLNFPHATPTPKSRKVPPRRITKTKRLEASIKLSQQLINGMHKKNCFTENHYKNKENYLDHRKEYEIKKLEVLENANVINSEILNTLKSIDQKIGKLVH